ncbi:porin [Guyparkeria sp. SCN-R1]|uniref:porin n=1 Tax=Guyparkeria sp. SCN-R1 TaxID=2341113 RepID=UPI0013159FF7|nr:porin [Guyparkeria sp. SCN-R1]
MKKNIIAMAVAAAVAAPAAAMADTTLYGKIHASYDFFDGDNLNDRDYSLGSNSSRIGVKGKEEISDNLSLIYQWEEQIDWGADGEGIGGPRNTFVGFTGDSWGTLIAGRHDTPMKMVGRKYDLFKDTVADARAITRGKALSGDNDWDARTNSTVAYMTPDMGGFQAKLAYISDMANDVNNNEDAYSISAGYEIAGFMLDGAWEQQNSDAGDMEAYRIGAGYKIGGFKFVGLYQNADVITANPANGDQDVWGLGAGYTFAGKHTLKAQYYTADDVSGAGNEDTGADLWAVGYDYKLSKQTSVYAVYASMEADTTGNGYLLGYKTAHSAQVEQAFDRGAVEDSSAFSVGVVHKF